MPADMLYNNISRHVVTVELITTNHSHVSWCIVGITSNHICDCRPDFNIQLTKILKTK